MITRSRVADFRQTSAVALVAVLAILALLWPSSVLAQSGEPATRELVELWISKHVKAERIWNRTLSKDGIAFSMDAQAEAALRQTGADDEWIDVLKRARYVPGSPAPESQSRAALPPSQGAPPQVVNTPRITKPSFSKSQLRPMYFGKEIRLTPYVTVVNLTELGGLADGYVVNTNSGPVVLKSPRLGPSALMYGASLGYGSVSFDVEGAFHGPIKTLNVGASLSPFLPLGSSGVRVIATVKPFLGLTSQDLATLPTLGPDGQPEVVMLQNTTAGGEVSAGLAYHWRPGQWIFVEVGYRGAWTWARELRIPGRDPITEGIPWSSWNARGYSFRMGFGF